MLVTYGLSKISCTIHFMHASKQFFNKALAYFVSAVSYECKMFMRLRPVANVIKLFTAVSYVYSARGFVPGKPFQPSLMFTGKAGTYPSEGPLRCSILGAPRLGMSPNNEV
jgi:hypothetical protein